MEIFSFLWIEEVGNTVCSCSLQQKDCLCPLYSSAVEPLHRDVARMKHIWLQLQTS